MKNILSALFVGLFLIVALQSAEAQTKRSRSYLWTRFETGDKPTQIDYRDLMASFLHLLEDSIYQGSIRGVDTVTTSVTLSGATNRQLPSALAVKTYVDNAVAAAGGSVSDGDKGDVTVSSSGATWNIDADAVGANEVASGAIGSDEIANGGVSNSDLATMTTGTFKGNVSGSTASPSDLTTTQVKTALAIQTTDISNYDEATEDKIGVKIVAGSNVTVSYNDSNGETTIAASGGGSLSDGDKGDITVSSSGATWNIDAGAVGTTEIADLAVSNAKIAADAVTATQIADNAVGASEIAANAVDASEITANAVGNSEMGDDAVGSTEIIAESIQASDIDTGAVTTLEILDATIATGDIANDAVTAAKIAADAVGSSEIAADAVAASEIATGAVTSTEILDGTIALADLSNAATIAGNANTAGDTLTNGFQKLLLDVDAGSIATRASGTTTQRTAANAYNVMLANATSSTGGTFTPDLSSANVFRHTVSSGSTLTVANATNNAGGRVGNVFRTLLKNSSGGSVTVSFGTTWLEQDWTQAGNLTLANNDSILLDWKSEFKSGAFVLTAMSDLGGGGSGASATANQVVYGTGSNITSSADWFWNGDSTYLAVTGVRIDLDSYKFLHSPGGGGSGLGGNENTALGWKAMQSFSAASTNYANTGIGYNALGNLTGATATGFANSRSNTAVGYTAGLGLVRGTANTYIGTASGVSAGDSTIYNVGLGWHAGYGLSNSQNTALGTHSMGTANSAISSTAVGAYALGFATSGNYNVAVGGQAMELSVSPGNYNTAVGMFSMRNINNSKVGLTGIGAWSLYSNTTGDYGTAGGYEAMYGNTTGGYNTAWGYNALKANTTANNNTAVGAYALTTATVSSGNNSAFGCEALKSATTAVHSTATGYRALYTTTTGNYNTANGSLALNLLTTGSYNNANGYQAMERSTTAANCNAMGALSLNLNTSGAHNCAVGTEALAFNTTANNNVAIGSFALGRKAIGSGKVGIGYFAGIYSSKDNTISIGYNANSNAADSAYTNVIVIGPNARPTSNSQITIGDSNSGHTTLKSRNYVFNIDQTLGAAQDGGMMDYNSSSGEMEVNTQFRVSSNRLFTNSLTDIVVAATDSAKVAAANIYLAPTNSVNIISTNQNPIDATGGFHSQSIFRAVNASGNAGIILANSADDNNTYNFYRVGDGNLMLSMSNDYPIAAEDDSIFHYNASTRVIDFRTSAIHLNGAPLAGTVGGAGQTNKIAYWTASGSVGFESSITVDSTNNRLGLGTATPDKTLGLGDGTDEFSVSVASDKLTIWNDASTPVAAVTVDSGGVLNAVGGLQINGAAITDGTWTPTLTNTLNLDGSTAYVCNYMRVGNTVTVSGRVDANPTATGGVLLEMSLPIASNFAAAENAGGSGAISTNIGVPIYASSTNDRLVFAYTATQTSSEPIHFSATYRIIP